VQVQQADQKQKQVRQEDPFMGEMREEPCQPCAFGEAFTQKLLERDGAEAGEGGGKRMTMKNRDTGERDGEQQKIDLHG
jgi:hypothetical protein